MNKYEFLNLNLTITSSVISGSDSVIFYNVNKQQPPGGVYINDDRDSSLFFINGQHIYKDKIFSITNSGSNLVVTFDTGGLKYSLGYSQNENTDNIVGVGKFVLLG